MNEADTLAGDLSENRHTEDMQEIITKVPTWITRWGITTVFGILLMAVVISIYIPYPETIKVELKIEAADTSTPVSSGANSKITRLFIKQGALVKRGQPLAELELLNDTNVISILHAPQAGRVNFAGIVQPGTLLSEHKNAFILHPENEHFFGIVQIPLNAIHKIRINQKVLASLRNRHADAYDQLTGLITYIADEPDKEGVFHAKVTFNSSVFKQPVQFKDWMTGEAEIVTQNTSLFKKITPNLF